MGCYKSIIYSYMQLCARSIRSWVRRVGHVGCSLQPHQRANSHNVYATNSICGSIASSPLRTYKMFCTRSNARARLIQCRLAKGAAEKESCLAHIKWQETKIPRTWCTRDILSGVAAACCRPQTYTRARYFIVYRMEFIHHKFIRRKKNSFCI